jgi:hypothetical protein
MEVNAKIQTKTTQSVQMSVLVTGRGLTMIPQNGNQTTLCADACQNNAHQKATNTSAILVRQTLMALVMDAVPVIRAIPSAILTSGSLLK